MKSFRSYIDEAIKPGSRVVVTRGEHKGRTGTVGEIHKGMHRSAEKTFVLDMTDNVPGSKNIRVSRNQIKIQKESVEEAKKYSMKQAIDWFGSDEKDIAWTMSSKKRGEPLFGHWLDMSTGEVVPAKEKNPPKGVKVYKKESVEEGKFIGDRYHHSIKDKDIPGEYVGRRGEDFISGTERVGRKTEFTVKAIKLGGWPKNLDKDRWLMTFPKGRGKPRELDGDEVRRVIQRYTKKKQMKNEELAGTSTADVVGTGDDVADWKDPKKKKKTKPLTRHFIEVGGKRRKLTK